MRYAAFIRGINVGGNVLIKMADMATMFEKEGLKNVKTILASGNAVFDSQKSAPALEKLLETMFKKNYNRDIFVLVRSMPELEKLAKLDPFKKIKVTKNTRLYVTFCKTKPKGIKPAKHPGFQILGTKDREIFSVLELSETVKTPDVMKIMGKEVGTTTMRNWNTIQKVLQHSDA
jgi:uncharacterized protein (DUF1697 family)